MSFTSIYVHSPVTSHEVDAPLLYTPSPPLEGRLRPLLCHSWFSWSRRTQIVFLGVIHFVRLLPLFIKLFSRRLRTLNNRLSSSIYILIRIASTHVSSVSRSASFYLPHGLVIFFIIAFFLISTSNHLFSHLFRFFFSFSFFLPFILQFFSSKNNA